MNEENEKRNHKKKGFIENLDPLNSYQIIVIMKSVIKTLSIISEVEPLSNEFLDKLIPDQNIIYLEKADSIQNLKDSLIQYLEKVNYIYIYIYYYNDNNNPLNNNYTKLKKKKKKKKFFFSFFCDKHLFIYANFFLFFISIFIVIFYIYNII